ncbi:hypothetical protein GCM10027569_78290 [Flindersiella endophytica]
MRQPDAPLERDQPGDSADSRLSPGCTGTARPGLLTLHALLRFTGQVVAGAVPVSHHLARGTRGRTSEPMYSESLSNSGRPEAGTLPAFSSPNVHAHGVSAFGRDRLGLDSDQHAEQLRVCAGHDHRGRVRTAHPLE